MVSWIEIIIGGFIFMLFLVIIIILIAILLTYRRKLESKGKFGKSAKDSSKSKNPSGSRPTGGK